MAYLVVLAGQLVMCALELDEEKQRREDKLHLQQRLKDELSNETFALLLASGFKEVRRSDPFTWDFRGALHSRSLMFSFTTVASIGYGDVAPSTTAGQVFCIIFTVFATPALVVAYLVAARKMLDFMHFLTMLMNEKNIRTFNKYDCDGSGQLNMEEFKVALNDLGYHVSDVDVNTIMEEVNICDSALVTIEEFGQAMILLDLPQAKYQKARQTAVLVFLVALSWLLLGTLCFMYVETWGFVESMWFCWETSMTIGLGDIIPQTDWGRWLNMVYSFVGLGHLALLTGTVVDMLTKQSSIVGRLEKQVLEGKAGSPNMAAVKNEQKRLKQAQHRISKVKASRVARSFSDFFRSDSFKAQNGEGSTDPSGVDERGIRAESSALDLEDVCSEDIPRDPDHNSGRDTVPAVLKSVRE